MKIDYSPVWSYDYVIRQHCAVMHMSYIISPDYFPALGPKYRDFLFLPIISKNHKSLIPRQL